MELYSKEHFRQVMDERVDFLGLVKTDQQRQYDEILMCKDKYKGIIHFFTNYVYTDKNTQLFGNESPDVLPLIPFEFQIEAINEIWGSIMTGTMPTEERTQLTNVFIEKSRQMGLSWIIMGIFVYGFVFHNHKYHCISQKETDVDKVGDMRSLFEKARFILNNLPDWMLPAGYTREVGSEHNKYLTISRSDGTGAITGESAHPNASRSGTYNAIFMDEMAFMANASAINTSAAAATPCRIFNSTPNGEGNEFFRMRRLTQRRQSEDTMKRLPPEVKGLRYHWKENPLYDDAWYAWKTKGMEVEKIAQELEINYNVALVGRVYQDFPEEYDPKVEFNPLLPVFVIIDNSHGGKDPHAMIIMQPENQYFNIIDACEFNCSVDDMVDIARNEPTVRLKEAQLQFLERYGTYNYQRAVFISDPFDTHSTVNDDTIYMKYKKKGIYLRIPRQRDNVNQIMNTRANVYRIRYGKYCKDYASAMMNARYPDRAENTKAVTPVTKPIHDWTSHYRTATEYMVNYMLENPLNKKPRVAEDDRPQRDKITRKIIHAPKSRVLVDDRMKRDKITRKLIPSR